MRAEAQGEERAVKALGDAFGTDWRAASEYLRRRHVDRWSTADRVTGSAQGFGWVSVERGARPPVPDVGPVSVTGPSVWRS